MLNHTSIIRIKTSVMYLQQQLVYKVKNNHGYKYVASIASTINNTFNRLSKTTIAIIKLLAIILSIIALYILLHIPANYAKQQSEQNNMLAQDLKWLMHQAQHINNIQHNYGNIINNLSDVKALKEYYVKINSPIIKGSKATINKKKQLNIIWKKVSIIEIFKIIDMLHKKGAIILDFNYQKINGHLSNTELLLKI